MTITTSTLHWIEAIDFIAIVTNIRKHVKHDWTMLGHVRQSDVTLFNARDCVIFFQWSKHAQRRSYLNLGMQEGIIVITCLILGVAKKILVKVIEIENFLYLKVQNQVKSIKFVGND